MRISKDVLERIKAHGRQAYPEECCGVLLGDINGDEKNVRHAIEIRNERQDQRERRFLITPEAYQHAEKEGRSRGLEILGFYHSHPDHPARPSRYDLEHAWVWFSYLILRVEGGEPREYTSWRLRGDRLVFDEEEVLQINGETSP
jgi:proteasome lid subunit RPN8/RPN11